MIPVLSFKDSNNAITNIPEYSGKGASRGLSNSDGSDGGWPRLNEEAMIEGKIGTIMNIDDTLKYLREQLLQHKELLKVLKEKAKIVVENTRCEWEARGDCGDCGGIDVTMIKECNVDKLYPPYVAQHIVVIESTIAMIETTIQLIGQTRTLYNYIEYDNMHFKERVIPESQL